jgi:hypothetical protein
MPVITTREPLILRGSRIFTNDIRRRPDQLFSSFRPSREILPYKLPFGQMSQPEELNLRRVIPMQLRQICGRILHNVPPKPPQFLDNRVLSCLE